MDGCWMAWQIGCVVDWNAWAAIATAAAVVSGAIAIWLETKRAHRMQRDEWRHAKELRDDEASQRADRTKQVTAVLAMAISKEAWRARTELGALVKVVTATNAQTFRNLMDAYSAGLPEVFSVSRQVVQHLDGFAPMDASAILNAAAIWADVPVFGEPPPRTLTYGDLLVLRPKLLASVTETIDVYESLMMRMQPYFQHVPGIEWVSPDEVLLRNNALLEANGALGAMGDGDAQDTSESHP